ncbi:AraC family transcriptional regulator [Cellulomonas endophytica]|uniref:AraC family transcriptional regulator n=1 Tax=Cellulomonas endophytica TaxID=2494735 RepID=UPI00101161FF|nr:AraC family transcriptional regulator [Cellulomonas endophytica]
MPLADGFDHERLSVVPRPVVAEALTRPVTRRLVVTDAGWFPEAAQHERRRPQGIPEAVVMVCVAGGGWVELGGVRSRVGVGTAVLLPPGLPHAYGADDDAPWTIWWLHCRGADVPDLLAAAGVGPERCTVALRHLDRCVALLDETVAAVERQHASAGLLLAAGAAWKLLTQIAVDRLLPEPHDPLERAMRYLADRLDAPVRVSELAALVGVSPSHLGALFRRATGGGVLAHHTALRMARARQLLDRTRLTVQQVGAEVGYTDPFYFSRHFRRTHGVSPQQYREHRKG